MQYALDSTNDVSLRVEEVDRRQEILNAHMKVVQCM